MNTSSLFYSHLVLIFFFSLFYIVGMLCFFSKRSKPSIKARKPALVLISATGLAIRDLLTIILSLISFSPLTGADASSSSFGCVLSILVNAVL